MHYSDYHSEVLTSGSVHSFIQVGMYVFALPKDHREKEKDLARAYQASMCYLRHNLYLTQTNQIKQQKIFFSVG